MGRGATESTPGHLVGVRSGSMRAYWVLATIIFLNFTARGVTFPFVSLYAISLGATLSQVALVFLGDQCAWP